MAVYYILGNYLFQRIFVAIILKVYALLCGRDCMFVCVHAGGGVSICVCARVCVKVGQVHQ